MSLFAVRDCFHQGHYYKTGAQYFPTQEESESGNIPRHFVSYISQDIINAAKEDDHHKTVSLIPAKEVVEEKKKGKK